MSPGEATSGDPSAQFIRLWAGLFEQADAQCQAMFKGIELCYDPRTVRRRWLEEMSRAMDGYLRSPAFLELMRTNLETMTNLKAIQDQFVQEFARQVGIPLAEDVRALSDRLRRSEAMLTARLEALESRLASIEARLETSLSPD
jgi:hypothetical protein